MLGGMFLKSSSSSSPRLNRLNSHRPHSQAGTSTENTPRSITSTQPSPTINLISREFALSVQTPSYNEMWSIIHAIYPKDLPDEDRNQGEQLLMENVLQPNHECIQEALVCAKPSTLTDLVTSYFAHSEKISHLCIILLRSTHSALSLYVHLHDLLDRLSLDTHSPTEAQCNWAFDAFLQFDSLDNPFPFHDSYDFNDMRQCFSHLRQELDLCLRKSHSKITLLRQGTTGSAICFIGTAVGVAIAAVAIAAHAFVAFAAAGTFLITCPSPKFAKKELAREAQLDAAKRGAFVLNNELDTIVQLVAWLRTAVEGDKLLIHLGLERGRDKDAIHEVLKQLQKNHQSFIKQLKDLKKHICICLVMVKRARSLLLQEIQHHQTYNS